MAKLSQRTFGVEFELFFTQANWDNFESDYSRFIDDDYEDESNDDYNEYPFIRRVLASLGLRGWEVVNDGSIDSETDDGVNAEIVTPILRGPEGLKQVITFCKVFRKYANVNESTGVHVHVDAADFASGNNAAERLTMALLQYGGLERVFDSLVMFHRRGQQAHYAKQTPNTEAIIERYKKLIITEDDNLKNMVRLLQGSSRYQKINLLSILKHGTIEFRQMHGTLNPELVKNWIIICTSFLDQIIETEGVFVKMFQDLKDSQSEIIRDINVDELTKRRTVSNLLYNLINILLDLRYFTYGYKPQGMPEVVKHINFEAVRELNYNGGLQTNNDYSKDEIINNTRYVVLHVPLQQFVPLFKEGNVVDNVKAILGLLKEEKSQLFKDVIIDFDEKDMIIKTKYSAMLKASPDSLDKRSPVRTSKDAEAKQVVVNNKLQLPARNISKLQKQTLSSPLKEKKNK